jgi:hypothetical protein
VEHIVRENNVFDVLKFYRTRWFNNGASNVLMLATTRHLGLEIFDRHLAQPGEARWRGCANNTTCTVWNGFGTVTLVTLLVTEQ